MQVRTLRKQHQLSLGISLFIAGAFAPKPAVTPASLLSPAELRAVRAIAVPNVSNEGFFNVARKKDGVVVAQAVSQAVADDMIAKAKAGKKAALEAVPA